MHLILSHTPGSFVVLNMDLSHLNFHNLRVTKTSATVVNVNIYSNLKHMTYALSVFKYKDFQLT